MRFRPQSRIKNQEVPYPLSQISRTFAHPHISISSIFSHMPNHDESSLPQVSPVGQTCHNKDEGNPQKLASGQTQINVISLKPFKCWSVRDGRSCFRRDNSPLINVTGLWMSYILVVEIFTGAMEHCVFIHHHCIENIINKQNTELQCFLHKLWKWILDPVKWVAGP